MSQVPQAPAAAAPPAPVVETAPAPATPAPAPPPVTAAPPAAPAAAPADGFVQMDKLRLQPWGGDSHAAIADATAQQSQVERFRQAGYSPEQMGQVLDMFLTPDQAGGYQAPAPGFPQPQPPAQPAFGPEEARTMFGEMIQNQLVPAMQQQFQSALGEHSTGLQNDWQYKQDVAAAVQKRSAAIKQVIDEVGFGEGNESLKTEDGSEHWLAQSVRRETEEALYDAMVNGAPEELLRRLGEEETQGISDGPVRKEWDQYMASPTDEHLAHARERAQHWRDLQFTLTAKTAAEQTGIPTSPGGGPAAGAAPKKPDEMSPEEHAEAAGKHEPLTPGDDDGSDWSRDH